MTDAEAPRKIRVVLCMGEYCNLGRRADAIHQAIAPVIRAANGDADPPRIKLETARCLSMCAVGPNLVIYPEDIVLNKQTPSRALEALEDYLNTHLPPPVS